MYRRWFIFYIWVAFVDFLIDMMFLVMLGSCSPFLLLDVLLPLLPFALVLVLHNDDDDEYADLRCMRHDEYEYGSGCC